MEVPRCRQQGKTRHLPLPALRQRQCEVTPHAVTKHEYRFTASLADEIEEAFQTVSDIVCQVEAALGVVRSPPIDEKSVDPICGEPTHEALPFGKVEYVSAVHKRRHDENRRPVVRAICRKFK